VETAIACWQRGWRPIWAASSAGCIRTFPVLAGIEHLTIFADFDATGLDAAMTCAQRWRDAGRDAVVRRRNKPGADYADR
jgi:hypothetical protein